MLCACLMVFNAIFNNISIISWRSVLLVEETGLLEENHWSYIRYVLNTNVHEFILIIFLLFVHIIRLFYRQVCFISKGLVGV